MPRRRWSSSASRTGCGWRRSCTSTTPSCCDGLEFPDKHAAMLIAEFADQRAARRAAGGARPAASRRCNRLARDRPGVADTRGGRGERVDGRGRGELLELPLALIESRRVPGRAGAAGPRLSRAAPRGGPCPRRSSGGRRRSRRCAGTCRARSVCLTWSCRAFVSVALGFVAVSEDDDGADDRAALVVGRGDHGGLGDRLVGDQRGLDLERADPVAGGDDHVVGAALEVQPAVFVGDAVAGLPRAFVGCVAEVVQEERGVGAPGRA